ncbi:MAG: YegP family protein [Xanthomonadales bacterium]|nr:YegP family protein [Xanthomonadales bacterium]
MPGKFELFQGKNKQYYFRLKAGNGECIMTSEGYTTKKAALNGVAAVRKNCGNDGRFEVREAKNGKKYFILKAGNHQEIGRSQMYASTQSCSKGMASVKRNGSSDRCDDLTDD